MLQKIPKILYNKYLLAFVFLIVWIVFFDETNLFTQIERLDELKTKNEKAAYYKNEIEIAKQELKDIKSNTESLEKFAREKYFMKKQGEEIFIIENPQ